MRTLAATTALTAFALLSATGCAETAETMDKARTCIEAPKAISETLDRVRRVVNDPDAMREEISAGITKLRDLADKAADTTLREALQGLTDRLERIQVSDVQQAAKAAAQVAKDTAEYLNKIREACL
ncbi:hypothetical protein [Thermobispora bispora]|uniref:hypothetical protein n=1 Tax=Thermobispora bispora TaxID=2006 RepID=UPI00197CD9BB|nr:hypothetical protein [Thermobispora bispora]MBX6168880.1 hypothetical protein [Thermobispora bispora]QSI48657.1 hypothetical protein CYL17_12940 [Thermobispora bispora]